MKTVVTFETCVRVTIDSSWAPEAQLAQIQRNAEREARGRLEKLRQENPDIGILNGNDGLHLKSITLEG